MSIKIMSAVFESETLRPTERLIMLALADHADDNGRCYPSIARLCQRTGLKERAVQTNIRTLQAAGYITIVPNAGRKGANIYFVRATPAADAPLQEVHPRITCALPPHILRDPPAADAPKPSRTIIEPLRADPHGSLSPDVDPRTKSAFSEIQTAFDAYNQAALQSGWPRAQTLNRTRKAGIAARLRECGGLEGWIAALSKAQSSSHCCGQNQRGWVADLDFIIQSKSFTRLMEGAYDNRIQTRGQHVPTGQSRGADPALANIARLVGLV